MENVGNRANKLSKLNENILKKKIIKKKQWKRIIDSDQSDSGKELSVEPEKEKKINKKIRLKKKDFRKLNLNKRITNKENPTYINFLKIFSFILLTLQPVAFLTIVRLSKIKNVNYKLKNETIVFFTEILKLIFSSLFFFIENGLSLKKMLKNITMLILKKKMFLFLLMIPAIFYYIQNICFYISLTFLPSPLIQIIYQFRLFSVILFSSLILKTKFKNAQLLSVVFVFFALIILHSDKLNETSIFLRRHEVFYFPKNNTFNITNTYKTFDICKTFNTHHTNNTELELYEKSEPRLQLQLQLQPTHAKCKKQRLTLIFYGTINKKLTKQNIFYNVFKKEVLLNRSYIHGRKFYESESNCSVLQLENIQHEQSKHNDRWKNYNSFKEENKEGKAEDIDVEMEIQMKPIIKKIQKETNIESINYKQLGITHYKNIILAITTAFLAATISGFAGVFLKYLHENVSISLWLYNMCLAIYTILISWFSQNFKLSILLKETFEQKFKQIEKKDFEKKKESQIFNDSKWENILKKEDKTEKTDDIKIENNDILKNITNEINKKQNVFYLKKIFLKQFYQYFNSFNDFLFTIYIIILNVIGGFLAAFLIKYTNNISRFFVTPISLLINIYISYIYFHDLNLTLKFFIALACVIISLFLYCDISFHK